KAELLCLSTNAHIALKQFIGCQVAVDQVTDFGELYRTTGIITGASQGQSDGALSIYKLTLNTPSHIAADKLLPGDDFEGNLLAG
ncbi:contractile injection system protein, VgrG/Pvc8 family, partial [Vogesella mureinivorans]|uniref:contractile injection system protein, VgrG/Pvc8 family n=1 Tax=Vogesella mureinivorans TaxID=657276 RepID=UPI0011CBDAA1